MNTLYGIIGVLLVIGVIVWPLAWWRGRRFSEPKEQIRFAQSVTLESLPGGGHNLHIDDEPFPWHVEQDATIEQWGGVPDAYVLRVGILIDVS